MAERAGEAHRLSRSWVTVGFRHRAQRLIAGRCCNAAQHVTMHAFTLKQSVRTVR